MITTLMKCKLCGKIISPPDETPLIGEPPQVRNQKIIQRLMRHMQNRVEAEAKLGAGEHLQAMADATVASQNFSGALLIGYFEISPDMEKGRQLVMQRIHEMTRSVRMADQEIDRIVAKRTEGMTHSLSTVAFVRAMYDALRDLRDRYEGLGQYAPVSASNPEQTGPADSATAAVSDTVSKA